MSSSEASQSASGPRGRYARVKALFLELRELPADRRAARLTEACAGDPELETEVHALLRAAERGPIPDSVQLGRARVPARIGAYRILGVLGTGGMGVVYRAEQERPQREVALKLIRPELLTPGILRRFELESDLLGRLHHPGVAQVYEAGTVVDEAGHQAMIVMELVDGVAITTWADERALSLRERLELVARVAEAVEHAHQNGVIHRDLKPANILVDAAGQPKIVDFGIARATDARGPAHRTHAGEILGTLAYMSPEQAAGRPDEVDSRADVYSLGVIAYQLLAGRLPLEVEELPLDESVRVIRTVEPTPLHRLNRSLRGDVSTVVAKALQKDKRQRYATASELGADVGRLLRDEPITARPPSAIYHLRKLARRNRGAVAAATLVVTALVVATVFSLSMARKERRAAGAAELARLEAQVQRDDAVQARDEAEAVARLLLDTISSVRPDESGREVTVHELLVPLVERVTRTFGSHPAVAGRLLAVTGIAFGGLGDQRAAEEHLDRAIGLLEAALGDGHPQALSARVERTGIYIGLGRGGDAERALEEQIPRLRALPEEHHGILADALFHLAQICRDQRRFGEAEAHASECYLLNSEQRGPVDARTLQAATNLGTILVDVGRAEEGEALLEELIVQTVDELGEHHPSTLLALEALAGCHHAQQRHDERAEELLLRVLEGSRHTHGDDHPATIVALLNVGTEYVDRGEAARALPFYEEALERCGDSFPPEHRYMIALRHNLAVAYAGTGRSQEAADILGELADDLRDFEGQEVLRCVVLSKYGASLIRLDRMDEAEEALLESYDGLLRDFGPDHVRTRIPVVNLIELYEARRDAAQAALWRARLAGG